MKHNVSHIEIMSNSFIDIITSIELHKIFFKLVEERFTQRTNELYL